MSEGAEVVFGIICGGQLGCLICIALYLRDIKRLLERR